MIYTEHLYLLKVWNFGMYEVESDYVTGPNKNPGHGVSKDLPW